MPCVKGNPWPIIRLTDTAGLNCQGLEWCHNVANAGAYGAFHGKPWRCWYCCVPAWGNDVQPGTPSRCIREKAAGWPVTTSSIKRDPAASLEVGRPHCAYWAADYGIWAGYEHLTVHARAKKTCASVIRFFSGCACQFEITCPGARHWQCAPGGPGVASLPGGIRPNHRRRHWMIALQRSCLQNRSVPASGRLSRSCTTPWPLLTTSS